MTTYESRVLNNFLLLRSKIINELDKGNLDKKAFLFENYMLLQRLNMKPYPNANTIEKCIYNYQYYNTMAKYLKAFPNKRDSYDTADNYYKKKDMTIISLLKNNELGEIIAYPLLLNSNKLNLRLFEIVLLDYELVILHSLNEEVKKLLIELGSYEKDARISKINDYVNRSY